MNAISARPARRRCTCPPDDDRLAIFLRGCDQRDMVREVDLHKVGALLLGEAALHDKEPPLQRLCARSFDRGEHACLVLRLQRADLDDAAVAEVFSDGVGVGVRHGLPTGRVIAVAITTEDLKVAAGA